MPDTSVDYQGVADGARQLRTIRTQLNEKTEQLKQRITNLITNGGFTTDVGSTALGEAVSRFVQANTKALEALERMASYLDSIPGMYQQADNQYKSIYDRYQPG
jgi:hypothetical protein